MTTLPSHANDEKRHMFMDSEVKDVTVIAPDFPMVRI